MVEAVSEAVAPVTGLAVSVMVDDEEAVTVGEVRVVVVAERVAPVKVKVHEVTVLLTRFNIEPNWAVKDVEVTEPSCTVKIPPGVPVNRVTTPEDQVVVRVVTDPPACTLQVTVVQVPALASTVPNTLIVVVVTPVVVNLSWEVTSKEPVPVIEPPYTSVVAVLTVRTADKVRLIGWMKPIISLLKVAAIATVTEPGVAVLLSILPVNVPPLIVKVTPFRIDMTEGEAWPKLTFVTDVELPT